MSVACYYVLAKPVAELVGYYLASLQLVLCKVLMHGDNVKFRDRREATAELRAAQDPWRPREEQRRKAECHCPLPFLYCLE
ncbi:hypothetical protein ENH_00032370, partial [Eimeria necatrix]